MGLVLDTNVFVHMERAKSPIDFSQWDYGAVYISTITVSELLVGIHYATDEAIKTRRTAFVEAILGKVPTLDFNTEVARVHAGLFASLAKQGRMIGVHDLIIAATALVHGCAVLTGNSSEFAQVPGLETIVFGKPQA